MLPAFTGRVAFDSLRRISVVVLGVLFGLCDASANEWITYQTAGSAIFQYRVLRVSRPVVYGEERMFINGKLIGGHYTWNADCVNYVMHGDFSTWKRNGNLWVSSTGRPAPPAVEDSFNRFCDYLYSR